MRHVYEIVRLGCAGASKHQIARRTGVVPSTVRATLKRFAASGLVWPQGDEVTDAALEAWMYRNAGKKQGHRQYAELDWAWVHRELKRKHVTLSIEYIAQHPDGYRYSRYVAKCRIEPGQWVGSPGLSRNIISRRAMTTGRTIDASAPVIVITGMASIFLNATSPSAIGAGYSQVPP